MYVRPINNLHLRSLPQSTTPIVHGVCNKLHTKYFVVDSGYMVYSMKYIITWAGTWPGYNADAKIPDVDRGASRKSKEPTGRMSVYRKGLGFEFRVPVLIARA